MVSELSVIALTLVAAFVASVAQFIFKRQLKAFPFNLKGILATFTNKAILLGLFLYFISFLLYLFALHEAPIISFVYPIFASTFIFVLLLSKYYLHEPIGWYRLAGMLLIFVGIVVVSLTF
jgi:drug/metabolite transporter (DMT)-like permease